MQEPEGEAHWTVRRLRGRWKPTKDRLVAEGRCEPTLIRFHRCCSWLQAIEQLESAGVDDPDTTLILRWVAFNSLYGRWDVQRREPVSDVEAMTEFARRMLRIDQAGRIVQALEINKRLVLSLFDDAYLARAFWREPSKLQARKPQRVKFDAQGWYVQGDHFLILDRVLDRIYLLRCQLMHGGATAGSKVNRTEVQRCSTMLGHLLTAFLLTYIDCGAEQDWGVINYPPVV